MTRNLFRMSEADLDRAVTKYYDRLYDRYYGLDRPDPCCGFCRYYMDGECCYGEWEEERESDDYCDHFDAREED